jgi:hypothetical protein
MCNTAKQALFAKKASYYTSKDAAVVCQPLSCSGACCSCRPSHLAHDLEVALLAVKHDFLAVGQALEVDLHDALEEGRVDGHGALVDGHSVLGVAAAVNGLQEGHTVQQ